MINQTPRGLRNFGFTLAALFIFFFSLIPYWKRQTVYLWPLAIAFVLSIAAIVRPKALAKIQAGWNRFGELLGAVNSRIVLGVIYALCFVPISMLRRMRGYDRMGRRLTRETESYRVTSVAAPPEQMERIY